MSVRCAGVKLGVFDLCHLDLLKEGCANSGGFGVRWIYQCMIRLQKSTVGGSPGPKIGNLCKNWQFLLFIGSDFLLEIHFLAIFGQYSFQQYFSGSLYDPLCCKNMRCVSRFWTGGREAWGSRSKNLSEGPWKQMLGQGHTLRLLDEAREVGRHQHPRPENQDSRHMIDQPRGSFPDERLRGSPSLLPCAGNEEHLLFSTSRRATATTQTDIWCNISEPIFRKGMRRSTFQWKKGDFSEKGGGNSVNEGLGKDFYRKGNSVKRFGPFTEPPDSENWKVAVLIPFPKISSKHIDCACVVAPLSATGKRHFRCGI